MENLQKNLIRNIIVIGAVSLNLFSGVVGKNEIHVGEKTLLFQRNMS